jgi:hypothetical protein
MSSESVLLRVDQVLCRSETAASASSREALAQSTARETRNVNTQNVNEVSFESNSNQRDSNRPRAKHVFGKQPCIKFSISCFTFRQRRLRQHRFQTAQPVKRQYRVSERSKASQCAKSCLCGTSGVAVGTKRRRVILPHHVYRDQTRLRAKALYSYDRSDGRHFGRRAQRDAAEACAHVGRRFRCDRSVARVRTMRTLETATSGTKATIPASSESRNASAMRARRIDSLHSAGTRTHPHIRYQWSSTEPSAQYVCVTC